MSSFLFFVVFSPLFSLPVPFNSTPFSYSSYVVGVQWVLAVLYFKSGWYRCLWISYYLSGGFIQTLRVYKLKVPTIIHTNIKLVPVILSVVSSLSLVRPLNATCATSLWVWGCFPHRSSLCVRIGFAFYVLGSSLPSSLQKRFNGKPTIL